MTSSKPTTNDRSSSTGARGRPKISQWLFEQPDRDGDRQRFRDGDRVPGRNDRDAGRASRGRDRERDEGDDNDVSSRFLGLNLGNEDHTSPDDVFPRLRAQYLSRQIFDVLFEDWQTTSRNTGIEHQDGLLQQSDSTSPNGSRQSDAPAADDAELSGLPAASNAEQTGHPSTNNSQQPQSRNRGGLKRPLDDDPDGSESGENVVGKSKRAKSQTNSLMFACPFFKKDPKHHHTCAGKKLNTIARMKQHLKRGHYKPHCQYCLETFESEKKRDEHSGTSQVSELGATCEGAARGRTYDGMSNGIFNWLSKKALGKDDEERWYSIFTTLFPHHKPLPSSPYINFDEPELLESRDTHDFGEFLGRIGHTAAVDQGIKLWRGTPTWSGEAEEAVKRCFKTSFSQLFEKWMASRQQKEKTESVSSSAGRDSSSTEDTGTPASSVSHRSYVDCKEDGNKGDLGGTTERAWSPPQWGNTIGVDGPLEVGFQNETSYEETDNYLSKPEFIPVTGIFDFADFGSGAEYGEAAWELARLEDMTSDFY